MGTCCGVMSGTGATLRSGRVRVFARRTVAEECGGRWVRIGMSDGSTFRDMLRRKVKGTKEVAREPRKVTSVGALPPKANVKLGLTTWATLTTTAKDDGSALKWVPDSCIVVGYRVKSIKSYDSMLSNKTISATRLRDRCARRRRRRPLAVTWRRLELLVPVLRHRYAPSCASGSAIALLAHRRSYHLEPCERWRRSQCILLPTLSMGAFVLTLLVNSSAPQNGFS